MEGNCGECKTLQAISDLIALQTVQYGGVEGYWGLFDSK